MARYPWKSLHDPKWKTATWWLSRKQCSSLQTYVQQGICSRRRYEPRKGFLLEPNELAHAVVDAASEKKAADIVLLDLTEIALIADYFVLCSGHSHRQLQAISDGIIKSMKERGTRPLSVEGERDTGWILIDFGSVVAHVFSPDLRTFYALEELWKEASVVVHIQ